MLLYHPKHSLSFKPLLTTGIFCPLADFCAVFVNIRFEQYCVSSRAHVSPSGGSLRECAEVAVRRKPAGRVSAEPGIMLIPWTSRGGNCLLHDGPLKSFSSHCGWSKDKFRPKCYFTLLVAANNYRNYLYIYMLLALLCD